MAAEERQETRPPGVHAAGHPTPKEYVRIGVILGVLTGLEISASYSGVSGSIMIPTLFVLALVKFALVVLWFMHLKFDNRLFSTMFILGFILALSVFTIALATVGGKLV